jgi:hypothetical protein
MRRDLLLFVCAKPQTIEELLPKGGTTASAA